ncbi:release factor glutamine methyltransferase [Tangfeifania diversioriginum]|uniref:peptide chain release factor N(5)-glutamine methyltransferase n=1 Tax=Tangfeifania diversioriginum TaxID=1168035 RepID=A0A1M6GT18_9BACT|nr:peptide chain release factor N(5)-glutamine methyltransferase [Tangfeifania diversioriginum]SHJ13067.1 release factor glutamine methyltransferase [Tangfeifania diversioriginum]
MEELFIKISRELRHSLIFLKDKPEENIDSTIRALWHKAYGNSVSAEKAVHLPLPQLSVNQENILQQLVQQRMRGIPLAHLTGRQNFMGIEFKCDPRALIPRKETEILGRKSHEICLKLSKEKSVIAIFDVCCGSGNLGLALASKHPNVKVYLSDLSPGAVELTKENIDFLKLGHKATAKQSDLFAGFDSAKYWGQIDLIVCNPPYISSSKVPKMNPEIASHEPALAFDGGMMGIKLIQKLIRESPKFLSENGWLIFEVGVGQGSFILQICEKSGDWEFVTSAKDTSGNIRVIAACCK